MYVRPTCSNLHTERFDNILTARWRASAWSDKMNKEQSAVVLVDLIRVKNMLNSTISMSYPDVVIACIEHKIVSGSIQSNWTLQVGTLIIWKVIPGGWLMPRCLIVENYLVCDRANTQSVTVRKVVKLQLNYCNALVLSEFTISSLFGGKNAGCSFFITFNWCICSLFWR